MVRLIDSSPVPLGKTCIRGMKMHVVYDPDADCPRCVEVTPATVNDVEIGREVEIEAGVYCGPVLRHPAELMLPAVDLGGRVWLGGKPCKGGPAAPAFGG